METSEQQLVIDSRGAWALGAAMLAGIVLAVKRRRWAGAVALLAGEAVLAGTITVTTPGTETSPNGSRRGTR